MSARFCFYSRSLILRGNWTGALLQIGMMYTTTDDYRHLPSYTAGRSRRRKCMTSTWSPALHAPPHPADRRHAERGPGFWDAKNEDRAIYGPVKPIRVHGKVSSLRALDCRRGKLFKVHETKAEGEALMLNGGLTMNVCCILGDTMSLFVPSERTCWVSDQSWGPCFSGQNQRSIL